MKKRVRCMADGGIVETPEQMMARMNAKYGLGGAGTAPTPPKPADKQQQPPAQPQRPTPDPREGLADAIGRRNEELKKAANYARGGIMPVMGIGSGTSDSIPVVVAGKHVRLSDGEGVAVLPKKTMATPGAAGAVEQIIESTNGKPVANSVQDGGGYVLGVVQDGNSFTQTDRGPTDPEEEKRRQAAAPTAQEVYAPAYRAVSDGITGALTGGTAQSANPAPTAQEVYRGVSAGGLLDAVTPKNNLADHPIYSGVSAGGLIDALTPGRGTAPAPATTPTVTATTPQAAAPTVNAAPIAVARPSPVTPAATPQVSTPPAVRSLWAGTDTRDERTGLEQEQARVAANQGLSDQIRALNGPSLLTSALVGDGKKPAAAAAPIASGATQSDVTKIDNAMPANAPTPGPNIAGTTGNAGDAKFNPDSGTLSFTQPGFDPTKQQFAPGTGAITDPKTGRTIMITGDQGAQPTGASRAAAGVMAGGVDAYGNSTARTDQMKAELAQLQANGSQTDGPRVSMLQSLPAEQAARDRFSNFVRQADADRLAHDLGTGGGNAATNAGKIAALNAMTAGIAASQRESGAREIAAARGVVDMNLADKQGRNRISEIGAQGNNQLQNTALAGQNQLAIEGARRTDPENVMKVAKLRGEVNDSAAAQAARQGLQAAIDSGDKAAIDKAHRKAVAAGVIKSEKPNNEYALTPLPTGGYVRTNKETGEMVQVDANGKATPVQTPGQQVIQAPQAALDALKKNPALAQAFQQKYGYLPQ